jgi:hypothetical protein
MCGATVLVKINTRPDSNYTSNYPESDSWFVDLSVYHNHSDVTNNSSRYS